MIVRKRSGILWIPIIVGTISSLILLSLDLLKDGTDFEQSALGRETTSVFSEVGGEKIHCSDLEDGASCLSGYNKNGYKKDVALWLGNSQLHAINQYRRGDENAPAILHRMLSQKGHYLVTYSQPNANLQEHYLLFEYIKSKLPIKLLILPVVFDDTREDGIRSKMTIAMQDANTRNALLGTEEGERIINSIQDASGQNNDLAALSNTVQEKVERSINTWLEEESVLWRSRSELRGQLYVALYRLRNTVFGIKATTKRRIIRGRYNKNMTSLKEILESAKNSNISTLVYIVPIRGDVEAPYDLSEYRKFKKDIETIASRADSTFVNMESVIPAKLWGTKDGTSIAGDTEIDFMHFQAAGHSLMASYIFKKLNEKILVRGAGNR